LLKDVTFIIIPIIVKMQQ